MYLNLPRVCRRHYCVLHVIPLVATRAECAPVYERSARLSFKMDVVLPFVCIATVISRKDDICCRRTSLMFIPVCWPIVQAIKHAASHAECSSTYCTRNTQRRLQWCRDPVFYKLVADQQPLGPEALSPFSSSRPAENTYGYCVVCGEL